MATTAARNDPFTLALGLSVLFHVLALALAAAPIVRETLAAWQALAASSVLLPAPTTPREIEVTVPKVTVEPPSPPPQTFIRTDGLAQAAPSTPDGRFISDRNTRAASELPAEDTGTRDLPSQQGIDIPVVEVIRTPLSEGEREDLPPQPVLLAEFTPPPPVEPTPVDPMEQPAEPPPTPIAEAAPPPPPLDLERIATTRDGEVVVQTDDAATKPMTEHDPRPTDASLPEAVATSLREPAPEVRQTAPARAATKPAQPVPIAPPAGFSSLREPTRQHGTITNRGPASVDAADTPVGRYMKEVTGAIEREWHRKRRSHADFVTYGTIQLEFSVNRRGQVQSLAIKNRNGANAVMQDFTLNAVLDAKIPPMPAGLPEIFDHDRLQISYDIIVY